MFYCRAVTLATECSCRTVLESLSQEFVKQHNIKNLCAHEFYPEESTSAILRHLDICEGMGSTEPNYKHSNDISSQLEDMGIQPASRGGYLLTFQNLCTRIHSSSLLLSDDDKVIIPSSMNSVDKRFMIRYLLGKGYDVGAIVVYGQNGKLRPPKDEEVETPPKRKRSTTNDSP